MTIGTRLTVKRCRDGVDRVDGAEIRDGFEYYLAGGLDSFTQIAGRRFAVEDVRDVRVGSSVHDEGTQPET